MSDNDEILNDKLEHVQLKKIMEDSFMDYSMSVIIQRALPDLRDGLKPVHRRILYSMYESGFTPDKAHQKSAKTVGNVIGNYHPHGDTAVYDSLARMAQDFSYRYCLIDGHGNFGSIDGFGPAAMRYTEARLAKLSMELLRDINKDTVNLIDNYDGSLKEPEVLPSRFPNILVNGTMGIAVGMATNIPPHNLGETIDGCIAYIDNPDITLDEMMKYVKGPDFPTGGIILGLSGIRKAYETGKGTITIRSKVEIEDNGHKTQIVIKEIPYQLNKNSIIRRIAEMVADKTIDGISDLHDDSNLEHGMRIIIDLKKDANANVVLNNLYKYTQLQTTYGINMLMIHDNRPKTLGLIEIIKHYIEYQKSVIYRRTKFNLDKALARAHILEGYKIALNNIDEIIQIIKTSKSDVIAKDTLKTKFGLSDAQSEAILEMKLRRLTGLEREKIEEELAELLKLIEEYKEILSNEEKLLAVIKDEMLEIKNKYSDERRTVIDTTTLEFIEDESLIPNENVLLTITKNGYIKRLTNDTYKTQNRGGVGVKGITTNDSDFVDQILTMNTHDYVLFFTNKGKVYRLKGYEIPEFSRTAKGLPIINLLAVEKGENINAIIKVEKDNNDKYLVFATKNGIIKRSLLEDFNNIRQSGKIAITLKDNDELIAVHKSDGRGKVLMCSSMGRMVRFDENYIRVMGRTAAGVKGITLVNDVCIGMEICSDSDNMVMVTENGYGKKTEVSEFRETKKGSKGVKALNITDKNGKIIAFKIINGDNDILIVTDEGIVIRLSVGSISQLSRVTQGVRLINLKKSNKVAAISLVDTSNAEEEVESEVNVQTED